MYWRHLPHVNRKCSSPVRLQTRPCTSRWNNRAGLGQIWKASKWIGSCSGSGKAPWSSGISRPQHQRGAKPSRDLDWPEAQVQTVLQAWQRSCLLACYLLPSSTYLPRMDSSSIGYWRSYSDSLLIAVPVHGDRAGGRRIFLPLSMLKRTSTGVSQSSHSRSYMGKAGSDAGAEA